MKLRLRPLMAVAIAMALSACSDPLEQERLTFNVPLDQDELAKMRAIESNLTQEQRARLEDAEQMQLRKKLHVILGAGVENETPVFLGYAGSKKDMGYAVYPDGSAAFLSGRGPVTPLLSAETSIFKVGVAGKNSDHIFARSARNVTVWNLNRPDEKLVLHKVEKTFEKDRIRDVVSLPNQNRMIIATGAGLSVWSLTSGSELARFATPDHPARKLARNMVKGQYFFGTRTGEVYKLTPGHSRTPRLLYKHSGPVLDILRDPKSGTLISSGKDGSVMMWSFKDQKVKHRFEFDAPVYDLVKAPTKQVILATPAKGSPAFLDITNGTRTAVRIPPRARVIHSEFATSQPILLTQLGRRTISVLPLGDQGKLWRSHPKVEGPLVDIALADKHNLIVLADDNGTLSYFDTQKRTLLLKAVHSEVSITGITLNRAQTRLLVGLADGRLLGLDLMREQTQTLRIKAK